MKKYYHILTLLILLFPISVCALSNAELSQKEYRYTLSLIRELNIIVQNFGTDEEREEYETIRRNFQRAAERHYARDFITITALSEQTAAIDNSTTSVDLFYELKLQLLEMYSTMAAVYLARTNNILEGTAREATDILIEYGKGSGLAKYFFARPVNPRTDIKPYDADKYHYFRERATIEAYLHDGYKYLEQARNVYQDVDFQYIKTKDVKSTRDLTYMIEKHRAAIIICRDAKECGIAIYKILNLHDLDGILRKYGVNDQSVIRFPIYDDRIPEQYKVDATDNRNLIWTVEKKRIGNYEQLNPDSADITDTNRQRQEMESDVVNEEDQQQNDNDHDEEEPAQEQ
ncbi:MAG: hypothetical protein ACOC2H_00945 [Spirochaetota bacterium]